MTKINGCVNDDTYWSVRVSTVNAINARVAFDLWVAVSALTKDIVNPSRAPEAALRTDVTNGDLVER